MVRLVRGALVALVAVLAAVVGALPASALSDGPTASPSPDEQVYGCINPVDGYGAPRACQLLVQVLAPICDNEVPKLKYTVDPVGTPNDKVTITFVNPSGPSVVYADQPLTGIVNWPGAVVGPDGRGIDWPGWTKLADGTWVEGDEFDWVRPNVKVLFEVNPSQTVTVAYPPSSPVCNTNPDEVLDTVVLASNPTSATLSATGSESQPLLIAGAALILVGGLAVGSVAIARRRRTI
ncbi:LPXTG cell wall anchor domain-containing protein [Cellulomonas sp. Leaf334]|uniref:LPXTG cell wall anchor domain-containing protein n=1 Tax=Cellulomonas sp. Leaf334 TaxID=1736339 RepID=UPI000700A017|nr:LPXTG cell wall anchor domain-containing protein [Cellulomonas sp. Leaf334]KQR12078.1 peptidase [Cellulomonas sp. Leaf334]